MPYAITTTGWRAVEAGWELFEGETYVEEIPQWLIDSIAAQEFLRLSTADLNSRLRLSTAQVSALQARVDAINDAIEGEYALPEEEEELPGRIIQLAAWKKYRVFLGRVSTQLTWPDAPVWPVEPEPYTNETSSARLAAPAV